MAKLGLTRNKVILCVWWDWKGIVHYEFLPPRKTIDSGFYCQQLMRLKKAVEKNQPELVNRKGVVFHHDNARLLLIYSQAAKIERAWLECVDASFV